MSSSHGKIVKDFLFTSESVNEGHPDKVCDQISDAIVDAILVQDSNGHIAAETGIKGNTVFLLGEITSDAEVDYNKVVRGVLKHIGYDSIDKGCDYSTCAILNYISNQSPDIAQAVHVNKTEAEIGAGDQGMMFGYATDESKEFMPMTHLLATRLGHRLSQVRHEKILPWLCPDGKTQVTMNYHEYEDGHIEPFEIDTIVISTQHAESVSNETIRTDIKKFVIDPIVPKNMITENTKFLINPSGRFVVGGPASDAGVTGRKIIVDTYGGWGSHGGGAFSGKDFTKVDRSAAYAARWIAVSLVNAGLCRRCLIQLSYAIGIPQPVSINVNTYGTSKYTEEELIAVVRKNFGLCPGEIVNELDLRKPRFSKTAAYGHFGRPEDKDFTWEQPKVLDLSVLKK